MMKTGVLGATGFTGEKLVEILLGHPKVELSYLASRTPKPEAYSKIFAKFEGKTSLECEPLDVETAAGKCDFLFLSLPHTVSMLFAPALLKKGKKVIDLSADYRLKNTGVYKKYYAVEHKDKANLNKAVYGLGELFKTKIAKAKLVANPGCYPTAIILALFPLFQAGIIKSKVIADAKSAISGAGRKAAWQYQETNSIADNLWAYKPFVHQHVPEIVEVLKLKIKEKIDLQFVPQVAPVEAGIYATIYVSFKKKTTIFAVKAVYEKYYKQCPFIRIKEDLPKLKDVVGTNFCDLGFALTEDGKSAVIVSAIDNLIKGAAGAAVQNMNIMQGWQETLGLV